MKENTKAKNRKEEILYITESNALDKMEQEEGHSPKGSSTEIGDPQ